MKTKPTPQVEIRQDSANFAAPANLALIRQVVADELDAEQEERRRKEAAAAEAKARFLAD